MQSWPSIEWNDKMLKIPTWNSKISRKPHCNCKVSTKALNIGIPIHIGVASGLSKYLNCKCSPFLPTSLCRMRLRLALKLGCQQHNTVLQPSDKRAKSSGEKKQLYYRQICLRKISTYTSLNIMRFNNAKVRTHSSKRPDRRVGSYFTPADICWYGTREKRPFFGKNTRIRVIWLTSKDSNSPCTCQENKTVFISHDYHFWVFLL